MITMEDCQKAQRELDEAHKYEVRFELAQMMRQRFVDWGRNRPGSFFFAVYSAANGAYDDLKKDVVRQHITLSQGIEILDKMFEFKLINQQTHNWHVQKITEAAQCQADIV